MPGYLSSLQNVLAQIVCYCNTKHTRKRKEKCICSSWFYSSFGVLSCTPTLHFVSIQWTSSLTTTQFCSSIPNPAKWTEFFPEAGEKEEVILSRRQLVLFRVSLTSSQLQKGHWLRVGEYNCNFIVLVFGIPQSVFSCYHL